jgi:hypothetical protein
VISDKVSHREQYVSALTFGKTGAELSKDLQAEAETIWNDVQRLADRPLLPKGVSDVTH